MERLVVLGGGESGIGTAILGLKKGYDVFVSDNGIIEEAYKEVLLNNKISFEEEGHSEELIFTADVVMKSPGIPDTVPLIVKLIKKGVKVISEIEFAAQFTDATIVGITGSNGKTTITMWINHILKSGGLNVGMAGNIGDSFALQVAENDFNEYVLELSSFQLDGIESFAPHIAIITNITPDHLDRYDYKIENYIESKFRITKNQTKDDFLIYDADDELIEIWLKKNKVKAKLLPFSLKEEFEEGGFLRGKEIITRINTNEFKMGITALALQGKHNVKNAMAASVTAQLLKIRKETIRESLEDFEGAEHRLEKVLKINGVEYVNDSKATNINAVFYALETMQTPIVWIVGGVDKGNDYSILKDLVTDKVKAIICLGKDNSKLHKAFGKIVDTIIDTESIVEAVRTSYYLAKDGDCVLLSPACASFD
ncbi:MAG: UDP-N-acetylmuramoyl-L-alanine--D-glutamate ligase, partial [Flavobacteriaceae bacterium]|nr:UDP-N-acetylmuramoyl-L-alanine--D-glutamate ligase [Flavobacteriaceae bacterium]